MRLLAAVLGGVLCAGLLAAGGPARAERIGRGPGDAGGRPPDSAVQVSSADSPPSPRPGSASEEAEYARREEASPDVQEYSGGNLFFMPFGFTTLLLILLAVWLLRTLTRR